MSRPTTRSKNKRNRPSDGEENTSELLRKIHLTGEMSSDDLNKLYMVWKPVCQGCRVNNKDSPNCFCGLAPPPNGVRKTGLWQRMPDIVLSLGPNPCKDLRSSTDTPAGLTNLGATCYANGILQCLYMNTSFRERLFSVELELLEQHPVLNQLARLFAQLHSSKMAFIDSAPFIKTLELDNGVQQDSHEFLTLFLSLLERSLRHSKVPKARTAVQDLFRGSVSHETRCSMCGKDSEASSKMEDFYELELNIKGLKNLDESLNDYLSLEELQGENQYFCQSCGTRVDATRCIKLQTLPAVLNFQLKRYIFLPKTTTKKKITSAFSFPRQLNMGQRLSNPPPHSEIMYDLSAILIHKGTAVDSGHYVVHIKDVNGGQWWEFDDEHVSKLGPHPFGEASPSSSAKSEPNMQHDHSEQSESFSNGDHTDDSKMLTNGSSFHEEIYSSTDCYMLMYTRRITQKNDYSSTALREHVNLNEKMSSENNSLPLYLSTEVEDFNKSNSVACEEYQLNKDRLVASINERRHEVRSILAEAPVHSVQDPCFWISTDWLRQWADSITPSCLQNSPIQCEHGRLPFSKVSAMKRLSSSAWEKLHSKYGGGPSLTSDDYCYDCLKDGAKTSVSAYDYRDRRASMKELAEAALAGKCSDGISYYVSKGWLMQWSRRKNADSPCDADAGPTASIRCPHGELLPEQAAGAKRVSVPEYLWLFLYESANAVKPDDLTGCSTFPSDLEQCALCSKDISEVACLEDSRRAVKLQQRQNHDKLFVGKSIALSPGCKYFLVPSLWLAKWRAYIGTNNKNTPEELESLEETISCLKCEKHSRLLERPLDLVLKRGSITQRASSTNGLTIITESDWKLFCDEWNLTEEKGISAEVTFACDNKLIGSCDESSVLEADLTVSSDGAKDDPESKQPILKTQPEICEECIGERESCELMRKLNYSDGDIRVFLVRGKEAPRSLLEASGSIPEPDRRISKRSRRTTFGNSINLKVSSSTSIYQLKMMIWESFGVVKENQKIHKGSTEIDGESATLADKNIFPGDVLWVMDSEIYENRDIADEISGQKLEPHQTEEGFRGTLLTSDIPALE
ncbi:Ubiquitin carboxyl-terminal hydrolase 26 [Acorus calamus]|uniref:Ubiquitin carboxyl-terminal hydrolase 26 n=1 Tax=Acorus calamus TaxID=4465 RepID=A0AAV9CX52_ACOCL|nr:Ubiquitin carboxyl-terminal hydrolase 26 [Acorus calamus]